MSHEQLFSRAIHLPLPPQLRSSEFPKWNRPLQSSDFQEGGASAPPKERNRASSYSRSLVTAPAVARSLDALSHSPCLSNRHTYEKLEPLVSHRKHSLGLFSNRHKTALHPRRGVCVPSALRNEASGARDLLVDVPVRQHHHSNRKAYVKLEIVLSSIKRATSIFLIARNTHFAQGEPAQFPCSSARSRTPRFGLAKLAAKPNLRCNFAGGKGVS